MKGVFEKIRVWFLQIDRKYLKLAGWILGIILALLVIAGFVGYGKREALLNQSIAQLKKQAQEEYQIDLTIDSAYFSGLREVTFNGIKAVPKARAPLLTVNYLDVSVKLWPLLTGKVKILDLHLHDANVSFIKKDSISNYDFLFRKGGAERDSTKSNEASLAVLAHRIINSVLYKIPENMGLQNFRMSYEDDSTRQTVDIPAASIDAGKLSSTLKINQHEATWHATGDLNADQQQLFIRLFAEGKPVEIPVIHKKFGLTLRFDTLEAELKGVDFNSQDELNVKSAWTIKNLTIHHRRIAAQNIRVPNGQLQANFLIGKDYVQLNKESDISMNGLKAHPYVKWTHGPDRTISLGLSMPETTAQTVFDGFPEGMFENLEGIRVSGKLKYDADLFIDFDHPDSVRLSSEMAKKDFRINSWGKTNLAKINIPFTYTPYEDGKPMRDILVGPDNTNFTPLNEISPYLKNAVLTAEDPSFFSHNGFVVEAIRNSISTNLKAKAFKRGGSTISMQLVKNIYLSRDKTLVRKIEEILMVWLMESNRIVSKQRMLEVYLNIIEWGRNVYGIGEASRFYFGKTPAQLTVGESIYLASIVPKPKSGLYPFQYDGHLKPYLGSYFRFIGNIMARRGLIASDSASYGFYSVLLREPLRPARPVDAAARDSVAVDNFEEELKETTNLLERLFGKDKTTNQEKEHK